MIVAENILKLNVSLKEFESFIDSILDISNQGKSESPVVAFLASKLDVKEEDVSGVFRYYKAFNKPSMTDAANAIKDSEFGFDFWYALYDAYQRKDLAGSYKNMVNIIVERIY